MNPTGDAIYHAPKRDRFPRWEADRDEISTDNSPTSIIFQTSVHLEKFHFTETNFEKVIKIKLIMNY